MDTVQEYRRYAAASLAMAKDANCPIEKNRLLLVAKGWLDLAATLAIITSVALAPLPGW
jgi:hypothetical protein